MSLQDIWWSKQRMGMLFWQEPAKYQPFWMLLTRIPNIWHLWRNIRSLLLLTGCGGDAKVSDQVFEGGVNTYEGVTMTVVEGTAYPGAVTVQILNTTDKEIDSGNAHDFGLQKEVDGEWYWLEMKKGSYSNTAEALIYSKDVPVEQELTWASRYGYTLASCPAAEDGRPRLRLERAYTNE